MSSQPSPRATEHDQTNDLDPDVVIARIVDEAPPLSDRIASQLSALLRARR